MENDPDEKESKGKRIIKKAKRRSSKSSNNSQNSALDPSVGVSRSKSFENKHLAVEINDSTPLPKPDGTKERHDYGANGCKIKSDDKTRMHSGTVVTNKDRVKMKKIVDIQETHNEVFEKVASASPKNVQPRKLDSDDEPFQKPESTKRILKRKLEEESGAGTSGASTTSDNDADDKDPKDKKKKNRCAVCRKKVGLTGFECRCGGLFCAVHRYSDKHECSFDYRELGAQEIRRNNPVVVSQKIHKI